MGDPAGLVVNRWRRYGKDRLYVEFPDGAKVGWWDLVTDERHPETPAYQALLTQAVTNWMNTTGPDTGARPRVGPVPPPPPAVPMLNVDAIPEREADPEPDPEPEPHPEPVTRPWVDLATNRAGAEAREQALSARDAAPVKTMFARVLGVHTDERAWRIGADGEEKVAAKIDKVIRKDPRWRVLHAIPVGTCGSDIDHLVIGPGGVFTINAKHHPGAKIWVGGNTFMVDGHKQPYIRNSRHEATRATKLLTAATGLPVHVEGLIVTVNAADVTIKAQPDGVTVVPRMQVARWLKRLGPVLTDNQIDAVYEAARRSTSWCT